MVGSRNGLEALKLKKFVGDSAQCKYCGGAVKMLKKLSTGMPQPNRCLCLLCGQRYYVESQVSLKIK
jgi:hypothetical protein